MTSPSSSAAPPASLITPQAAPASTTTSPPLPSPPSTTTGTTTTTTNPQSTTSHPPAPSTTTSLSSLPFPPLPHHAHPHPPPPSTTPSHSNPLSPTLPGPPRQIAEARQALVASIGNMLDASLRDRASVLHSNSAAISKQEKDVAKATDSLRRENDKLAKVAGDAARRVKELGNVQNWAEVLERDFLVLEETLRLVRGEGDGSEDGSGSCGSGSGSWSGSESGEGSERGDERDGDGDVLMDGGGKGKGKEVEVEVEVDQMEVDSTELVMPALRMEESSVNGNGTGDAAMHGSDVGLPAVRTGKGEPSIKVPGIETQSSKISLEDELRSAMAESIANIE